MKRIFTACMAVLLFVCIPVTVSAAEEYKIDSTGQSVTVSVKAVFKENTAPNVYKNDVSDGGASIRTKDGITVTVSGGKDAFEPGARLVVREITAEETEAYSWFSGVMKDTGTGILPFDIYFELGGQRIQLNTTIQITITLPDGYMSPLVCYVTTDGKAEILSSSVQDGRITFETDHTSYYVVADQIKDPGDIPQTGENTNLPLYGLLMVFSAGILLIITVKYKNQSKR